MNSSHEIVVYYITASSSCLHSDEDFLSSADALKGEEGTEVWPPNVYDPLGPLELPFGPRTRHTRTLLAGEVHILNDT